MLFIFPSVCPEAGLLWLVGSGVGNQGDFHGSGSRGPQGPSRGRGWGANGSCKLQDEVRVRGDLGGGKMKWQQNLPDTIIATFA